MKATQYRLNQSTQQSIGKYFTVNLILLAQLVLSNSSIAASRVFVDDFEGGISSSWKRDSVRDPCTVVSRTVDGAGSYNGNQMLSCNYNGVVSWNAHDAVETLKLPSWSYNKEFLIRFKIRAGKDGDKPVDGPKYIRMGADEDSVFTGQFGGGGRAAFTNDARGLIANNLYFPSVFGTSAWHEQEIYIYEDATAGIIKIWVDGNLVHNLTGINTTQSKGGWAPFHLSSNWSGGSPGERVHDASNHVYWDKFEIYSDTGTGAIGSLSDGTISVSTTAPSAMAPPNPPIPE